MAQPTSHDTCETQALFVVVAVVSFQCIRIRLGKSAWLVVRVYIELLCMRSATLPRMRRLVATGRSWGVCVSSCFYFVCLEYTFGAARVIQYNTRIL